uniref:Ring finger protein 207a n=1 Tax=Gasterosteus aculeatus TaxID=69293 RepID=G3NK81_GASAC
MIGEVCLNVEEEESAICSLFNSLQEKLAERKKILLKAAQSQHAEKEKALKEQLSHLTALLPTLQVHLVTCSAFLSSANKFEFLDMGYAPVAALGVFPLAVPQRDAAGLGVRPKARLSPQRLHQGAPGRGEGNALHRALPQL